MSAKIFCDKCEILIKELPCGGFFDFNSHSMILCAKHKKELEDIEKAISIDRIEQIDTWKKNKKIN